MTVKAAELENMIRSAFPIYPIPDDFFRDNNLISTDIPSELKNRLFSKKWSDVTLMDWRMTGAHIGSIITYMTPDAFRYYLPSLLIGSMHDPKYLDYSVQALLPFNNEHLPKGRWWNSFFNGFDKIKKAAIQQFLLFAFETTVDGSSDRHLTELAIKTIWGLN
jgi:hypothetical protein